MKVETPTTPYLIRAIWEWCNDNGYTPFLAVKVNNETRVPPEFVRNGEIVLNVSTDASRNLKIGNEVIQFSARFNGVSREISIPVNAVSGIFAKENGQGLAFQPAEKSMPSKEIRAKGNPPKTDDSSGSPSNGRPRLHVVK